MSDYVTKAEAWDALAQVPPKTQVELDQLRKISDLATSVAMHAGEYAPQEDPWVKVSVYQLNELRQALGLEPHPYVAPPSR